MATPELNLTGVLEPPPPPVGRSPASAPRRRDTAAPRAQIPPVDPRLDSFVQNVMGDASARTGYTYKLGEGSRTPEQEAGKVAAGYSRTYNSKHLSGRGRDVLAFDSEGRYITDGAHEAYKTLGDVYRERARDAGLPVRWGGDFHNFYDPGHFEIDDDGGEESAAPALKLDGVLEPVDDEEVVSTEATVDSATGRALSLADPRRRQTVDASTVPLSTTPQGPSLSLFRREPAPDVRTMEGRAARDRRAQLERTLSAYLDVLVPVSDVARADGDQIVRGAYRSAVEARGVPGEFFDEWVKANEPEGYHIGDGRGEDMTIADAYEDDLKGVPLRLRADYVSKIVDAYKHSRGTFGRLKDWASSDDESPGEKALDAAGTVAAPVVKGAGYVARPFQAVSAGVFSAARGHNPLPVAYQTVTTGETPQEGTNPVGNYLRDSAVLNRINPRLGRLLGGGADVLLDPANLIGLGILGKGAKAVAGAGRLGRAAEEVNALGRSLGLLERGLVDARPLGLGGEAVAGGGELAALEDRLSRVLEVTRKLKAGERLTPEEVALHAEVKAAAEAAPSAAIRVEQLKYASERAAHYEEVARAAKTAGARRTARELADDYAREVERLSAPKSEAALGGEGYDLADASAPRFNPRPEDPAASLWRRGASNARAVVQLPKAKAGFDLSATGRQGLAQVAAHPSYLKEAFARQVKAFASEDAFNSFRAEIMGRADFEQMQKSGLFLSSVGPEAEEVFASKIARKIPGVRASDRAYSAALDSIRTQAWDNYVGSLPAHLKDNPETLKAVSELINISTGRGVVPVLDRLALGKKVIDILNVPFFSPRNTASKFNLISPARLAKNMMSAEARPVAYLQLRDGARGLASLGTTLGLLHLAGADVSVNPYSSDFGKVRVGKAVYDLTGGEGYTVRYLAQMAHTAMNEARGKKIPKGAGLTELTRRYLRTQLQPLAATGADWWTGKTIDGRKVTTASAALNLITPFVVDDVIKGFQAEGLLGAAKATPGVLGVGVNLYDKPKQGRGPRYAPASESPEPSPSATPTPQLNLDGIVEPSESSTHEEISRAVDSADAEAEPTFREFPVGMSDPAVPRASMPQIKSEHRGAMVQFLKGRGITHRQEEVSADALKPSQAEYSPEKVRRALGYEGPERSILISSDNYVTDGHHQWLSALHKNPRRRIPVIRLDAPIRQLLLEMARFPSSGVDDASA